MTNILTTVKEEVINSFNEGYENVDFNNMSIQDLANVSIDNNKLYDTGADMLKFFTDLYRNAFTKGGNPEVIKQFKEANKVDLFSVSKGHFSFTPHFE
jgi:hypothetical protein